MPVQARPTLRRLSIRFLYLVAALTAQTGAVAQTTQTLERAANRTAFPPELVHWSQRAGNPVFTAGRVGDWDAKIRERGWILRERDQYHLWYTGYDGKRESIKQLGHATSPDGIRWKRSAKNPLSGDHWVEDMMVVKCGGTYYMFAEGDRNEFSVMLTSCDGDSWTWQGRLDVRMADGKTPVPEPVGTPTVWIEDGTWYLFYERLDKGIWLAKSGDVDARVWINVQDEPVLVHGPEAYDEDMIALNQVIKHKGVYYAFYHGSGKSTPRTWNTDIARSDDLIHWQKYRGNPLIEDNKSSGIVVPIGRGYRLYTMHDQVDVFDSADER
jgi:beta-1,2-mannobiose phosphorylase / 1,2-beta-oligomannan phosphorylase